MTLQEALEIPPRDALPEGHEYRDEGCEVASRCLECPLPACRYEFPRGIQDIQQGQRYAAIRSRRAEGASHAAISAELGVSLRTVQRALSAGGSA